MINLDDKQTYLKTNGGEAVLTSVNAFPEQLNVSFHEALKLSLPQEYKTVKNVVVCGMGGSRFPALILKELFKEVFTLPYTINDDYHLPGYVGPDTLVILSSYSGTTEEVITCGKLAKQMGAKVTGVTAGGEIASMLKEMGAPVYIFDPVLNPSNQPRIGFGYSIGGHLGLLMNLGFVKYDQAQIEEALQSLPGLISSYLIEVPEEKNEMKQLARKLFNKYPYYIVSEFLTGVGNAVANQTNETAKAISSFRVIPELNHHLMEGLKFPQELHELATFVFFYSSLYSAPIQKRFHITKEVVEQNQIGTIWHELKGKSSVAQALELCALGTYLTMYMAALYEQDPSTIPFVDYFKKRLKEV